VISRAHWAAYDGLNFNCWALEKVNKIDQLLFSLTLPSKSSQPTNQLALSERYLAENSLQSYILLNATEFDVNCQC